jgi:uncharacterized protein YndB with AHSA1/START domain
MPTATRTREIAAPVEQLWDVISDPNHLPRWWPRVTRVEGVFEGAFTEVMKTRKGKTMRADFEIVERDPLEHRVRWDQQLEGTPFAGVLRSSETELRLKAPDELSLTATEVTIEMRQVLSQGWEPDGRVLRKVMPGGGGLGARLVRKAAMEMIAEALDGLEQISV